jgi:hypothetical protein
MSLTYSLASNVQLQVLHARMYAAWAARLPVPGLPVREVPPDKQEAPGVSAPEASTDRNSWAEEQDGGCCPHGTR